MYDMYNCVYYMGVSAMPFHNVLSHSTCLISEVSSLLSKQRFKKEKSSVRERMLGSLFLPVRKDYRGNPSLKILRRLCVCYAL